MSLKLKISLILLAVFAGLFAANAMVLGLVLWPNFERLEMREAQRDMARVSGAVENDTAALANAVADWAVWDDAWRFARDRNPAFVKSNLVPSALSTLDIELLYFYDAAGNRIAGRAEAPKGGKPMELALFPSRLPPGHLLTRLPPEQRAVAGVIATERGPLLLAACRILTSNGEGPGRGFVVMGRLLTDDRITALGKRVQVNGLEVLPPAERTGLVPGEPQLRVRSGEVQAAIAIPSLAGPPALVVHTHLPRDITASGSHAVNVTLVALILTVAVVLVAVLAVIQRLAVNPLTRLTAHVQRVAESGNLGDYLTDEREDEFGFLTREFNRMQWRISRLALYDQLTDLPNRVVFMEHLGRAVSRSTRTGRALAVLQVNLDGFKGVNERFGPVAGDLLLKELAHRFRTNLRICDIVARFEGDGFAILLEDLQEEERALVVAEKVLRLFDRPFDLGDHAAAITASIGIALYPKHAGGAEELVLAADVAMYSAKRAGKNQFYLYSDQLPEESMPRLRDPFGS